MHMVVPHHMHDHHDGSFSGLTYHEHTACHLTTHSASNLTAIDHHHHGDHSNHICHAPIIPGCREELLSGTNHFNSDKADGYAWHTDLFNLYSEIYITSVSWQPCSSYGIQDGIIASKLFRGPPVTSWLLSIQLKVLSFVAVRTFHRSILLINGLAHKVSYFIGETAKFPFRG